MHNFGLALLSSFLLVAILHELAGHVALHAGSGPVRTAWVFFCDPSPHVLRNGRLLFLYYLNYITKYLELSDTVLLCLRGKPLPFLHVYHHAATLVLCWTQLAAKSSVQWIPIVLNLMVHVPMYYYYAVATLGKSPWWKKHLTTAQIVQFCLDVPATAVATGLKARPLRAGLCACAVPAALTHAACSLPACRTDERGVQVELVWGRQHGLRLRLALRRLLRHRPPAQLPGARRRRLLAAPGCREPERFPPCLAASRSSCSSTFSSRRTSAAWRGGARPRPTGGRRRSEVGTLRLHRASHADAAPAGSVRCHGAASRAHPGVLLCAIAR